MIEWQYSDVSHCALSNKFIVVIPCYNAEETIENTILSVLHQDFDDLGIIIRNDMSTDGTGEKVKEIFKVDPAKTSFLVTHERRSVIYIENAKKLYGGGNTYDSVINYVASPYSIVGVVDGDDHLVVENAISKVYQAYQDNPGKWLIWSQHFSAARKYSNIIGYSDYLPPDEIIYNTRAYWSVSHFRTCLAGLFQFIDPADLADPYDRNEYAKVCGDAAFLYPMIELCGNRSSLFLEDVLYYYNDVLNSNDINVYHSEIDFYKRYYEYKKSYPQLPADIDF